jgi:hypothetical protein
MPELRPLELERVPAFLPDGPESAAPNGALEPFGIHLVLTGGLDGLLAVLDVVDGDGGGWRCRPEHRRMGRHRAIAGAR